MRIKPFGNRFTAEEINEEITEKTEFGFLVTSNPHSKPMKVKVIEISDDFDYNGLELKVGDVVLISKYGSTSVKEGRYPQKHYQLCNKLDVIGIL